MTSRIPYPLLSKDKWIERINELTLTGQPFIFIISYNAEYAYIICENEIDSNFIQYEFAANSLAPASIGKPVKEWQIFPVSFEEYKSKFDYIQHQIHQGNSFLVNLTQPTRIATGLSLEEIYERSFARYKLWLKDWLVVMSPETFVRIENGVIYSNPMKGTIDASIVDAEQIIMNDQKEKAEHATIVDLIRNDISMIASGVEVVRYRYIDRIKTNKGALLQVSSEIRALLPDDYPQKMGNIISSLLPAGSICGAPKKKTLQIIDEAEQYERGFYTGIFGRFDGKNLDSAVMIRFIEHIDDQLFFKSGGGITSKSDCQSEYNELLQKVYVPLY